MEEGLKTFDVERLGRERPAVFASAWREAAFVISILVALSMSDFITGGFQVVLPSLNKSLNISAEEQAWPTTILTLVAGAFLFPLGRVADMFGGYFVFNAGLLWFLAWTVAAGFSINLPMLTVCRAMEGLGLAALLPAGISLLGKIYRPGPRKNFVFSLYGAIAPVGFFAGIMAAGAAQDLMTWRWYYWWGSILGFIACVGTVLFTPNDYAEVRADGVKMDWWGVCTTIPGLMLVIYAISNTSSAPQGWASPQIIAPLIIGVLFLGVAIYVEGWIAESPLIPPDIFHVQYMKRMLACLFLTWGAFSIYLFYSPYYLQKVSGKSPLLAAAYFAPWAVGGLFFATISGLMLHIVPGLWLLVISGVSKAAALLFFALMPEKPNYWQWVFPAMVFETACVDVLWTVSNVYLTTSLPRQRQGLAGALINVTLFLGSAFFVAIADIAAAELQKTKLSLKDQYQSIFWLGFGVACVALVICFFIRLGRAGSRLTPEEEAQLNGQPSTESVHIEVSAETISNEQTTGYIAEIRPGPASSVNEAVVGAGHAAESMRVWSADNMDQMERMANVTVCEVLEILADGSSSDDAEGKKHTI